jgi:hypothetical protein
LYIKEAEQQQAKLDKFVAAGAESWDINNAVRSALLSEGHILA